MSFELQSPVSFLSVPAGTLIYGDDSSPSTIPTDFYSLFFVQYVHFVLSISVRCPPSIRISTHTLPGIVHSSTSRRVPPGRLDSGRLYNRLSTPPSTGMDVLVSCPLLSVLSRPRCFSFIVLLCLNTRFPRSPVPFVSSRDLAQGSYTGGLLHCRTHLSLSRRSHPQSTRCEVHRTDSSPDPARGPPSEKDVRKVSNTIHTNDRPPPLVHPSTSFTRFASLFHLTMGLS